MISTRAAALLLCILALRSEQAVLKTYDLQTQMLYGCPESAEFSCIVLWKLSPHSGLLGPSDNFYRLQCTESPPIDSACELPNMFAFNSTKLIKPIEGRAHVSSDTISRYRDSGNFMDMGCKSTQSAVCISLTGQAFKLKSTHYIFSLRCKDVLEKNCGSQPFTIGDKVTSIMPFKELSNDMLISDVF